MRRPKPCRECGRSIIFWQAPGGRWRPFDSQPVPFMGSVPGLVLHRTRGLVDAGTVWPEPSEMLPRHNCRQRAATLVSLADCFSDYIRQHAPDRWQESLT